MWCARNGRWAKGLGLQLKESWGSLWWFLAPWSPGTCFFLYRRMLFSGRRRLLTALLQAQWWPFQPSRDMRLVQFQAPHLMGPHLGLESGNGGGVINLNAVDPTLPKTMVEFLEQGEATLSVVRR